MEIKCVDIAKELLGIVQLQAENHSDHLSNTYKTQNGFVTVKHTYEMLVKMNSKAPQIIVKENDEVIAYALVMLKESKDLIPVLTPMFKVFETIKYEGEKLSELNYYVMGQICVKDTHRRQGIFKKLYVKHREEYSKLYDYCITEVSTSNIPSLAAHQKLGFKTIHTFSDDTDEWDILLWDWK